MRGFASMLALVSAGLLSCADVAEEDGDASGDRGDGDDRGDHPDAGRCDVYDGKDEFMECVCEEAKPCIGFGRPEECSDALTPAFKSWQYEGGLDCVQAMGNLFSCQFALTCGEYENIVDYWNYCWDEDPGGSEQPYCRAETRALDRACGMNFTPCG